MAGLYRYSKERPEGKYLVQRRDGSTPEWPYIVLGAADPCSSVALRVYANKAEDLGFDPNYIFDILKLADEFDEYRRKHGEGDPDFVSPRIDDPEIIEKLRKAQSA